MYMYIHAVSSVAIYEGCMESIAVQWERMQ